ncbi:Rrf2 family transcriptional regulator [Pollutibacter soli]|uniref:RrF2 family transcriptional regulator n=1 Tax=Pollutibacter soli TaxID=3034157 RepID=UPI003013C54F
MFSKTCEHAIRAMIFVAQKSRMGEKTGIREIAKAVDSPEQFIAKILQDLSRKGLVRSLKGPTGGFFHDEHTLNRPIADIVKALDGDKIFKNCALGLKQCSESHPCPLHEEFKKLRNGISLLLEKTTLSKCSEVQAKHLVFLRR